MSSSLTAIEFFSGIGGFADACRFAEIEVIAAFDQNIQANKVYESNFGLTPGSRNLESIKARDIEKASVWWMSPPCTPYSRRGKQKDDQDPRSQSLLNLIELIPDRLPEFIFLENVEGFAHSRVNERLLKTLDSSGFHVLAFKLCSSSFGVPMRRPRYFIAASRTVTLSQPDIDSFRENRRLADYLLEEAFANADLLLDQDVADQYRPVLNIVDPNEEGSYLICFTRGYFKCRKASGSMIQLRNGRIRFVDPYEALDLFGFSEHFRFPEGMPISMRLKLIGNSVDVRAVKAVLSTAGLAT